MSCNKTLTNEWVLSCFFVPCFFSRYFGCRIETRDGSASFQKKHLESSSYSHVCNHKTRYINLRPGQWENKVILWLLAASTRWVEIRVRLSPHKCSLPVTRQCGSATQFSAFGSREFGRSRGSHAGGRFWPCSCSEKEFVSLTTFTRWPPASTKWLIPHTKSSTPSSFSGKFPSLRQNGG